MAKTKDLLNLEALLRVRKVSFEDFVLSQGGSSVEEKLAKVKSSFTLSDALLEKAKTFGLVREEQKEVDNVMFSVVSTEPKEESKRGRKKKQVAGEEEDVESDSEDKEEESVD